MEEVRSPWSPPRRARTARGIRATTPTSCFNFDSGDDPKYRASFSGTGLVSPYAISSWRQRLPSASAGGREGSRSPSARGKRPEFRNPFTTAQTSHNLAKSLRLFNIPTTSAPCLQPSQPLALMQHSHSIQRSSITAALTPTRNRPASSPTIGGSRRSPASASTPAAPSILSPPLSPAKSPAGTVTDLRISASGRAPSPAPSMLPPETDPYAAQMLALTEHLMGVAEKRRKSGSEVGLAVGPGGPSTLLHGATFQKRPSDMPRSSGISSDRESILIGQISVAAMQQRLQHKFGEEAAAFMLHDLKEVPEHLHVLFYLVILQLRELPNPLPSSLGEAYHAVFHQHFDRTVSAAERRHVAYRTQVAQWQVNSQLQLEALQAKANETSPRGTRPSPTAAQQASQLQQRQRLAQQQAAEHQAQLKAYAAQAIAAQELHTQVMRLLCVAVAAQERLALPQLAAMGMDGVLENLPAWEVLFHAREGVLMMADPSLEHWLRDRKAAKQFACDPRIGHLVLGRHYRALAERDVRSLDAYGLRYAVLHLLLSEDEVTGGERLLMDCEYMEQVFRLQEEGTLYLTLLRMTHKTEVVSESLRWLRANMGALRANPRAVSTLWQAAPSRTLFARMAAASEGRSCAPVLKHLTSATFTGPTGTTYSPRAAGGGGAAATHGSMEDTEWGQRCDGDRANGSENGATTAGQGHGHSHPHLPTQPQSNSHPHPHPTSHPHHHDHNSPYNIHHDTHGKHKGPEPVPPASSSPSSPATGLGRRQCRPQCRLLNPPPFWPAAITQLPGHAGGVTCLVFDRRNRLLTAATAAGNVIAWDHATARRVGLLTGYSPSVPCVDMHPSGKLLAVGSSTDCAVRVRALDSGSGPLLCFTEPMPDPVVKTLIGPKNTVVRHLSYSPDGHLLAVVYGDGTVTVWDPVKGVRSSTMPVVNRGAAARYASFSPNGQLLALACANGTIRVWHLERLHPLHISVLRAYDTAVPLRCVLYSPSGLLLASLAEGGGEVLLWDVATGSQLQALAGPAGGAPVRAMAFNPGGLLLALAGEDGEVAIWNANTRGQWSQAACLRGHSFAVNALAFSPCGLVLATGGNEDVVRLWDVGAILNRSEAQRADNGYGLGTAAGGGGGGGGAQSACIVVRGDEAAATGRHPAPGVITCLTHNPAGTQLAAGFADGGVCVWDAAAPRRLTRLATHHQRPVGRLVYSTDGRLLATASDDGCICVWNTTPLDVNSVGLLVAIQADSAFFMVMGTTASFAGGEADGATADGTGGGGTTTAWAAPGAAHRRIGAGGWVTLSCTISFSHDGRHLASAHDDGTVLFWALPSGAVAARLRGHSMLASGLQYSPNGRLLASWSDDGTVCVWEPEAALRAAAEDRPPEPLTRLAHRDHVYGVDFSPCSSALATISRDGHLCTWGARAGLCTGRAPHGHCVDTKSCVDAIRYSPLGLVLATSSVNDATIRLWHSVSCVLLREINGAQLMGWYGLGPAPWAAVLQRDYSPLVVRLPERALLLEAAAIDAGEAPSSSTEHAAAAADEVAEGLAGAAVGLQMPPAVGPAAVRRLEQLQRCRRVVLRLRTDDPLRPLLPDRNPPLRPSVRIFSSTRTVPYASLRGRSLVLSDSGSTAFYSVAHECSGAGAGGGSGGAFEAGTRPTFTK